MKNLDKVAHCSICAFLTLAIAQFANPFVAVWAVVAISIAKELADKYAGGSCDWLDLAADAVGVGLGLLAFALIHV